MRAAQYLFPIVAAVATLNLAACGDTTVATPTLFNDSTATLDVAASSGDAAAEAISAMLVSETSAGVTAEYVGSTALFEGGPRTP